MPATQLPISFHYPSFPRSPAPAPAPAPAHAHTPNDQPPAYTSILPNPPSYSFLNRERSADRGNYAFAIMQHNLRFNIDSDINQSSPSTTNPPSRTGTPSPSPEPLPTATPETPPPRTTRAQEAALRDFEASQNPELWGRRVGHGRHARLIRDERQGFWAWLGELFVDEEQGRAIVFSAGSPWGFIGVTGNV